jgi:excinuclease UvrABC nuclease subunit
MTEIEIEIELSTRRLQKIANCNYSEKIDVSDYDYLAPPINTKGVYLLYSNNGKILYIGRSYRCIRGRLCNHLITSTPYRYDEDVNNYMLGKRKNYSFFRYIKMDENKDIKDLEYILIQCFKPKFNIQYNQNK